MKKLSIFAISLLFAGTAMFSSCGEAEKKKEEVKEVVEEVKETVKEEVKEAVDYTAMAAYYTATCVACHGANGEGNEAMKAPALAGENAKFDAAAWEKTIKEGKEGTIMVAFPDADAPNLVKYLNEKLGK